MLIQVVRADDGVLDGDLAFLELGELDFRAKIAERHRKIRVVHLPGQDVAQRSVEVARAIDRHVIARHEQRREERKPRDVVPMGVPEHQVR